jgi:hypothetical protein
MLGPHQLLKEPFCRGNVTFSAEHKADAFINFRRVSLYPAKDSRVIHVEPALTHHLLDVAVRKLVAAVPSHAQKDDRGLEVAPLERGFMLLQECDSRGMVAELKGGL